MRYYSNTPTGRPSKDPIMLVKILLIQSLEGFRSVRLTCKQVQSNATYRWFLGIHLFEKYLIIVQFLVFMGTSERTSILVSVV